MVLAGLAQSFLKDKIEIKSKIGRGSILEVKEVKGLGTTIDVILYDGEVKKGDVGAPTTSSTLFSIDQLLSCREIVLS